MELNFQLMLLHFWKKSKTFCHCSSDCDFYERKDQTVKQTEIGKPNINNICYFPKLLYHTNNVTIFYWNETLLQNFHNKSSTVRIFCNNGCILQRLCKNVVRIILLYSRHFTVAIYLNDEYLIHRLRRLWSKHSVYLRSDSIGNIQVFHRVFWAVLKWNCRMNPKLYDSKLF